MSSFGDLFGSSSFDQTTETQLSGSRKKQQKRLLAMQVELAELQLGTVKKAIATNTLQSAETTGLLQEQIGIFRDALSEDTFAEDQASIKESADRAIQVGNTDIERFRTQSIDDLLGRIAPSRGLRPTDSPIIDRGEDIAAESVRQGGQLVNSVRGQQADFERQLRERAFENRLRIGGALGDIGLQQQQIGVGLASGIPADVRGTLAGISATGQQITSGGGSSTGAGIQNLGALAGGAGGLLEGVSLAFG